MPEPLALYDNAFSPYAFKVRTILYEKGIAHEKHELVTAADREALLRVNPRGEVPAIVHGETLVSDSAVIGEYLEQVFPEPPLIPADAAGAARCRSLERLADGPLDAAVITLALVRFLRPDLDERVPGVADRATRQIESLFAHLEDLLGDEPFFCGTFSRADIAIAPHLKGGAILGVTPEGPRLAAWQQRVFEREAFARADAEFVAAFQASREQAEPFFSNDHVHVRDHRLEWAFRLGLAEWAVEALASGELRFSPVP